MVGLWSCPLFLSLENASGGPSPKCVKFLRTRIEAWGERPHGFWKAQECEHPRGRMIHGAPVWNGDPVDPYKKLICIPKSSKNQGNLKLYVAMIDPSSRDGFLEAYKLVAACRAFGRSRRKWQFLKTCSKSQGAWVFWVPALSDGYVLKTKNRWLWGILLSNILGIIIIHHGKSF